MFREERNSGSMRIRLHNRKEDCFWPGIKHYWRKVQRVEVPLIAHRNDAHILPDRRKSEQFPAMHSFEQCDFADSAVSAL